MPLNLRASKKINGFNTSVSYRIQDRSGKFIDARNVFSVQNRLDTRFGTSRFNAISLGGKVQSLSSFTRPNGDNYLIAKVGTDLVIVSPTGAHTSAGLTLDADATHRGITINDRHIIAIEGTFLYFFQINSSGVAEFSKLGQYAPTSFSAAVATGGSLVASNKYKVAITFYATKTGFETNYLESSELTTNVTDKQINLTGLPTTAENKSIDRVYIYLKDVTANGPYRFVDEIVLGAASTYSITDVTASTQTPPTTHDFPARNAFDLTGENGAKYLANFNSKLVIAGNNGTPNEVYFSEPNLPDAFDSTDSATVLVVPGQGGVTGLATGLFNDSALDPFLVIFKKKSIHIYSELGDSPKFVTISDEIGCVSQDTIQVKNGVVYFLSEEGWRAISNGRLLVDSDGNAATLGNGDIDDIFKSPGYLYEVNRVGMSRTFSVYYPTLDQYMTWVSEGANSAYTKTYVYQFETNGFIPYEFKVPATCAVLGETSQGRDIVLFGTQDGFILKHSIMESRSDVDSSNNAVAIPAFAVLPWMPEDQQADFDATYNFRELILKAIVSSNPLTVKTYVDYNLATIDQNDYDFTSPESGFILDISALDVGVLGDDRSIKTARTDISRVGECIAIGFYQEIIGANMGLVSMQIDSNKNGNRNLYNDTYQGDGGYETDSESYFANVVESVRQAEEYAALAAAAANGVLGEGTIYLGDADSDGSWRLRVENSVLLIEVRSAGEWIAVDNFNP